MIGIGFGVRTSQGASSARQSRPASSRSTRLAGSSESRAATAAPAEPPPTTMTSYIALLLNVPEHRDSGRYQTARTGGTRLSPDYPIPLPNLFDFGNPFGGRRPASAREPFHSASSFMVAENSRPAESFQVRPVLASNTAMSERPPSLYFCRRTPRPRAISGTWSSGNT